jgi:hypothetical protein
MCQVVVVIGQCWCVWDVGNCGLKRWHASDLFYGVECSATRIAKSRCSSAALCGELMTRVAKSAVGLAPRKQFIINNCIIVSCPISTAVTCPNSLSSPSVPSILLQNTLRRCEVVILVFIWKMVAHPADSNGPHTNLTPSQQLDLSGGLSMLFMINPAAVFKKLAVQCLVRKN